LADDQDFTSNLDTVHPARLSPLDDAEFAPDIARQRLQDHLGVTTLEGFGCDKLPLATAAAGGVLYYLKSNQISDLVHIVRLRTYDLTAYVGLDAVTRRNLELIRTLRDRRHKGSLYERIDRSLTAMGGRMLRRWLLQPLLDIDTIRDRQDAVGEWVEQALLRADLRSALEGLYDMERLVGRIGFGNANARDLVALRQTLERIPQIKKLLAQAQSARSRSLNNELDAEMAKRVSTLIAQAIVNEPPILLKEGGIIRAGYDKGLEQLRQVAATGRDWLTTFETQERERTGIKNLRVSYNQVFGFFIQVTKSNLHLVPQEYERRATVRHAERFVTPALKECETQILAAEEQINELEYDLFVKVRQCVANDSADLTQAARVLAELDVLTTLAETAALYGYVRPTVDKSDTIAIREGRHPVVECTLAEGERFVPNDTSLAQDERLMILTGPNMSGKSVYIRQVALIVLLAQIGSFVPAKQAHIGTVDRIFVRAGASDDITQGRSTFLVEMSETSYILRHATARSLVVLDEVGRGTSTYDGMSIAWSVAQELHDAIRARTLFATHFHELTRLIEHLPAARNYTLAMTEKGHQIIFLRQLIPGGADKSYGIQVARLAGIPERVLARAQKVLAELEQNQETDERQISVAESQEMVRNTSDHLAYLLPGIDQENIWAILSELYHLDIANMTPVQALVALNDLQGKLGK
jgi:DNA mismatch repair protein MutS